MYVWNINQSHKSIAMRKDGSYLHDKNFCPSYQVSITNVVCAWMNLNRRDAIHLFLIYWALDAVEGINNSFTSWKKKEKKNRYT